MLVIQFICLLFVFSHNVLDFLVFVSFLILDNCGDVFHFWHFVVDFSLFRFYLAWLLYFRLAKYLITFFFLVRCLPCWFLFSFFSHVLICSWYFLVYYHFVVDFSLVAFSFWFVWRFSLQFTRRDALKSFLLLVFSSISRYSVM